MIEYGIATKEDINELIRLRIAYMKADFGNVSEEEKLGMEKQLPDYFRRKLGTELIAFTARDKGHIVSVAYLHIIEMPANSVLLSGLYGDVLSVYTEPEYRGRGLCSTLIKNLIEHAKKLGLGRIDLKATDDGYSVYEKAGFKEIKQKYRNMRYTIE